MIADDGAPPARGQGMQAHRRLSVPSIPVDFSPDPGPKPQEIRGTKAERPPAAAAPRPVTPAPVAAPAPVATAAAQQQPPRHPARHRAPKNSVPRSIAALWTRARDAISAP